MHKAKAVAILCIDFRFHDKIQAWLKENQYLGHTDIISVAGVCRDLVKPLEKYHEQSLLREIELSIKLHDPDEILVFDHEQCGGYAQDETIPSDLTTDQDRQAHIEYAKKVKSYLEERFPNKKVVSLYVPLEGEIERLL